MESVSGGAAQKQLRDTFEKKRYPCSPELSYFVLRQMACGEAQGTSEQGLQLGARRDCLDCLSPRFLPKTVWQVLTRICNLSRLEAFEFRGPVRGRVSSDLKERAEKATGIKQEQL